MANLISIEKKKTAVLSASRLASKDVDIAAECLFDPMLPKFLLVHVSLFNGVAFDPILLPCC